MVLTTMPGAGEVDSGLRISCGGNQLSRSQSSFHKECQGRSTSGSQASRTRGKLLDLTHEHDYLESRITAGSSGLQPLLFHGLGFIREGWSVEFNGKSEHEP